MWNDLKEEVVEASSVHETKERLDECSYEDSTNRTQVTTVL